MPVRMQTIAEIKFMGEISTISYMNKRGTELKQLKEGFLWLS
jgi:hypothetical protein